MITINNISGLGLFLFLSTSLFSQSIQIGLETRLSPTRIDWKAQTPAQLVSGQAVLPIESRWSKAWTFWARKPLNSRISVESGLSLQQLRASYNITEEALLTESSFLSEREARLDYWSIPLRLYHFIPLGNQNIFFFQAVGIQVNIVHRYKDQYSFTPFELMINSGGNSLLQQGEIEVSEELSKKRGLNPDLEGIVGLKIMLSDRFFIELGANLQYRTGDLEEIEVLYQIPMQETGKGIYSFDRMIWGILVHLGYEL